MDRIFSQFRRIYSDDGKGDVDFSKQEEKLRLSHERLTKATQDLMKASMRLNDVAVSIDDGSKPGESASEEPKPYH